MTIQELLDKHHKSAAVVILDDEGNISGSGGFNIPLHDTIDLTYTGTDITGVVFSKSGSTVATLVLTYGVNGLTKVVKS